MAEAQDFFIVSSAYRATGSWLPILVGGKLCTCVLNNIFDPCNRDLLKSWCSSTKIRL